MQSLTSLRSAVWLVWLFDIKSLSSLRSTVFWISMKYIPEPKEHILSQYRHWWGVFTIPKALSIPSMMFFLVTDKGLIIFLTFICTEKEENRKKNTFLPCWENSVTEVMFLPGIGGHLKVSHMDPRVSFGNESTNLSVQKSFLPFYIKSSHPNICVCCSRYMYIIC